MNAGTPTPRFPTFRYSTGVVWKTGRSCSLASDGKPHLSIASPPEFKGEAGLWTPEDLYVAAVETCQLMTFIYVAERRKLPVISYESRAEGVLEFAEGGYRFTRIVVSPVIVVEGGVAEEEVRSAVREAHDRCLMVNSIKTEVRVEPIITFQ